MVESSIQSYYTVSKSISCTQSKKIDVHVHTMIHSFLKAKVGKQQVLQGSVIA